MMVCLNKLVAEDQKSSLNPVLKIDLNQATIHCSGAWIAEKLKFLTGEVPSRVPNTSQWALDETQLRGVDLSGAWVLYQWIEVQRQHGSVVHYRKESSLGALLTQVETLNCIEVQKQQQVQEEGLPIFYRLLQDLIKGGNAFLDKVRSEIGFLGLIATAVFTFWSRIRSFRFTAFCHQLNQVGLKSIPIVAVISFLIGIVLVYQGATQLKKFGAEIFTIDLLGVSVLREVSVLLTAIVIAGRSGSAFAAQIGTMKLNQELDALYVLGMNVYDTLVLPRVYALMVALPLLTFWSDMVALMGGGLMACYSLDLPFEHFLEQLKGAVTPWTFWVGMIKAPFFAFIIAGAGCYEGLSMKGGAQGVGVHTTKAVVKGIFLVIVCDAVFSVLFSRLRW